MAVIVRCRHPLHGVSSRDLMADRTDPKLRVLEMQQLLCQDPALP
uniref:Uncharacterized protein n=1 Tax=Rhizobium rhizogenes TaxID=359 RepID=A0A7S5DRZ7_RHIRH|nr:hypothetical protein pC6.5d_663 [Rhizobium rhizogenes]